MASPPRFEDFEVGQRGGFVHRLDAAEIVAFAHLSGDHNPVHLDLPAAIAAGFPGPIAHGVLLAALISRLLGMDLPGPGAVIQSLRLDFRAPAFAGDLLEVSATLTQVVPALRTLVFTVAVRRGPVSLVTGKAQVGWPEAQAI